VRCWCHEKVTTHRRRESPVIRGTRLAARRHKAASFAYRAPPDQRRHHCLHSPAVAMPTTLVIFIQYCFSYRMMLCLPRCLSVCLSHAGIASKKLNIFSNFLHRLVAKPFCFFHTIRCGNIPTGTPNWVCMV